MDQDVGALRRRIRSFFSCPVDCSLYWNMERPETVVIQNEQGRNPHSMRAMKRSSNASREVSEEVGINLPLGRFQLLTVYEGIDVEIGGPIRAEFFVVQNVSLTQIRVTEGCLVVANAEKLPRL